MAPPNSTWSDVLLAVVLGVAMVICLAVKDPADVGMWSATILLSAAIVLRRPFPVESAGAFAAIGLIIRGASDLSVANNNGAVGDMTTVATFIVVFMVAYTLGADGTLINGLLGAGLLLTGLNLATAGFNPVLEVIVLGPWAGGRVVGLRRRLTEQLAARSLELDAEEERFADESVRYERARMARELHDIVAHSVSVMVVQATAGQRLLNSDPERAIEALDAIAATATQAEEELGRLVRILESDSAQGQRPSLRLLDQLVDQASRSGIEITCRFEGAWDALSDDASDAAYRVVQEAITNALKHAPGSPINISVHEGEQGIALEIVNGPARHAGSRLEKSGGGHGLKGMRERIEACAGHFESGPTGDHGWRVFAELPAVA